MKRSSLWIGGAGVLAAAIALWIWTRGAPTPSAEGAAGGGGAKKPDVVGQAQAPSAPPPQIDPTPAGGGDTAVKDYMVGDVRVRDHRPGHQVEADVPPAIHPPIGPRIPSTLSMAIAQQLRGATSACGAEAPAEARGVKPRVDGTVTISVKGNQATVTAATFAARDVTGDAAAAVKRCFEQRVMGQVVPASDAPDVDGYALSLQMVLP
jgi:hypothetical protein